jgi:hypothetical protein
MSAFGTVAGLTGGALLAPLLTITSPAYGITETPSVVPKAQVVLDWQQTAVRTVFTENATPAPVGAPYLGFTSLTVLDALDRAGRRDRTSAHAATAVAAHHVLEEYFPQSETSLDADLARSLAAVPAGPAKRRGSRVGARAAAALIADRADDGRNDASVVYDKPAAPGVWQPPATGMLAPWLGYTDLLILDSHLRVDGPDRLTSAAYARDFEEVRLYGSANSTERSAEQTEIARFFNDNPVAQLTRALVEHLEEHPLGLERSALLFAAVHGSMTDALIQAWRLKNEQGFWRPVEAISAADTDGNAATAAEPGWTPLVPTPPYSDYLTGHGAVTGATAEVIRLLLGERTALTLASSITATTRAYPRLAALERDALNARIWLGIHFRDAMEDGYSLAHRTARRVLRTLR